MDLQIILIFILALLTLNLIFVGFYVVVVLKEFRQTIKKSNEILDDVHQVSDTITNPATALTGIVAGVTEGVKAIKAITSLVDTKKEDEDL
jgi:uncharacterized protein YoxC